ncbi:hypothetical protein GH714_035762 [Hevea brasiliensis]|uniref:DUF7780 domain-containing protein n=1 Tax=Hevea brasiliensis TaxID=3981 RepID=A0A6A6KKA6_HEVBR|nr:hypothetical protein GH714_035762 [Hevea brasiliensis]
MGKLYSRGTRAMSDLVVAHVVEDTDEDEFRLFLRLLHRSGLTARADLVFLFGSSSSESRFEVSEAWKTGNGESVWGKGIRVKNSNDSDESEGELTQLSYGSVVGFEVSELNPENSLAGFLDHLPMSLRRWACYPMLLGRVRRYFKHIMLVDVKKLLLLIDPLGRFRNRRPESVYMSTKQETTSSTKHGKRRNNNNKNKNSDKSQSHYQVNSAILMGGTRGIRRFSNTMLTEIVRVSMRHRKGKSITESAILSQLAGNEHILKNVDLIKLTEPIPVASELSELNSTGQGDNYRIIQRDNGNHDLNSIIMKHICSCEVDSRVYRDC